MLKGLGVAEDWTLVLLLSPALMGPHHRRLLMTNMNQHHISLLCLLQFFLVYLEYKLFHQMQTYRCRP